MPIRRRVPQYDDFFFSSCQKMKDDSDGDKKQQIHHIQNLYAFNLFCQKRFDDSMQVFAKLGTGESPDTRRLSLRQHSANQCFCSTFTT